MDTIAERDVQADRLLAGLGVEELRAGLKRGREQLAMLDADEAIDRQAIADDIGHPGRHPSRSYEAWSQEFTERRRAHLRSAVKDVAAELARRGETA